MQELAFWFVALFAAIAVYRLLRSWQPSPKARVTAMLRLYHRLERSGLSEQDSLLRLLATRRDWKRLPHPFLAEIVRRFGTKEDVMRFVSVSEDYGYQRRAYPALAERGDLEAAMAEIACIFARFGFRLQEEGRYREAEFVQKLALRLQPDQYFTTLPLAATYHRMGRHADALPLFERGLVQLERYGKSALESRDLSPAKCLGPDEGLKKLRARYRSMYEECRKARREEAGA
jgi:tetratricopeptide (TPR) repeat protein